MPKMPKKCQKMPKTSVEKIGPRLKFSVVRRSSYWSSKAGAKNQGDQIGRFFAYLVIGYFGHFL
jgi:hypothetical protein